MSKDTPASRFIPRKTMGEVINLAQYKRARHIRGNSGATLIDVVGYDAIVAYEKLTEAEKKSIADEYPVTE